MKPLDHLNVDFKGPLSPSHAGNCYTLMFVDEYTRFQIVDEYRFPFTFPSKDMTATTITSCLAKLFSIFGLPNYVHSDRGGSFMSSELK